MVCDGVLESYIRVYGLKTPPQFSEGYRSRGLPLKTHMDRLTEDSECPEAKPALRPDAKRAGGHEPMPGRIKDLKPLPLRQIVPRRCRGKFVVRRSLKYPPSRRERYDREPRARLLRHVDRSRQDDFHDVRLTPSGLRGLA